MNCDSASYVVTSIFREGKKIGGEKEKNVLTNSRNRSRCTHHVGSNATKLCSSHGGVSESIGGKLPEQFKETDLKGVACGS